MIKTGHIDKVWTDEILESFDFKFRDMSESPDQGRDMYIWDDFDASERFRHLVGMELTIVENTDVFWTDDPWPRLHHKVVAIHRMKPGMLQPLHGDLYKRYREQNNVQRLSSIRRVLVFLSDWHMGQMFHLADKSYDGWQSGDWVSWTGTDMHIASNLGSRNRYTLQITGIE